MPAPHPADRARGALGRAPLPVHHVDLWGHFFPTLGTGEMQLASWTEDGTDRETYRVLHRHHFGPFGSGELLHLYGDAFKHRYAMMTGWPDTVASFPDPWRIVGDG